MDLLRKPELQQRLAAEFALGTLRGRARQRFRRFMAEDPVLAAAVQDWELRLAPMAAVVAPVQPPARVWRAIEERIGGAPMRSDGIWANLAFWRNFGLAASGMAAGLLAAIAFIAPQAPSPAPAPVVVRVPSGEMAATYLAVLSDPKTQRPVLVVSAGRSSNDLWVKTLDPAIHVPDRSLELWALPPGQAPKSLGIIAPSEKMMALKLVASADQALAEVPTLAVSLEPAGGSPTGAPTGQVLYTGPFLKYW
jgi:anti-sigma-K factor RskA